MRGGDTGWCKTRYKIFVYSSVEIEKEAMTTQSSGAIKYSGPRNPSRIYPAQQQSDYSPHGAVPKEEEKITASFWKAVSTFLKFKSFVAGKFGISDDVCGENSIWFNVSSPPAKPVPYSSDQKKFGNFCSGFCFPLFVFFFRVRWLLNTFFFLNPTSP